MTLGATIACGGSVADAPVTPAAPRTLVAMGGDSSFGDFVRLAFACAAQRGGRVSCWGFDLIEGWNRSPLVGLAPRLVAGLDHVVELAAGDLHACARGEDGSVRCWGKNGARQSAPDSTAGVVGPTLVARAPNAVRIVAGIGFSCALLADGTVPCWGSCSSGASCVMASGAVDLSYGLADHVCALMKDGSVVCWGSNRQAQLGAGDFDEHATPVTVPGLSGVRALAVRQGHSSALLDDGSVVCWGDCGSGYAFHPSPIPNMRGTVDLGSGANFDNCVRTYDGKVRCACLGVTSAVLSAAHNDSDRSCDFSFAEVDGLTGATSVSHYAKSACAPLEDGSVWCWGQGQRGTLGDSVDHSGDGTPPPTFPPTKVPLPFGQR